MLYTRSADVQHLDFCACVIPNRCYKYKQDVLARCGYSTKQSQRYFKRYSHMFVLGGSIVTSKKSDTRNATVDEEILVHTTVYQPSTSSPTAA